MRDDLVPGITLTLLLNIGDVPRTAGQPPIPAATLLVGCMERACIEALRPHLLDDEDTASTQICLGDLTPIPMGTRIAAQAELIAVEGCLLRFSVRCYDEGGLIGSGFHERVIINTARSTEALGRRAAALVAA